MSLDYVALTEIVFEWADSYDNKVSLCRGMLI
jgi:hypothetical protein